MLYENSIYDTLHNRRTHPVFAGCIKFKFRKIMGSYLWLLYECLLSLPQIKIKK